ncbi:MAG: hypothetical protein AAFY08_12925 [Planctomycetota bacterium]
MNPEQIAAEFIRPDRIEQRLGLGYHGAVYATSRGSAVKVHERRHTYQTELLVYRRLGARRVSRIGMFSVPQLVGHDDDCLIIEMTAVRPPYLLDFGQVTLDSPPDFPIPWREHVAARIDEKFDDEQQASIASSIVSQLQWKYGIYYLDMKPGNIEF